jgi:hypothetical protein
MLLLDQLWSYYVKSPKSAFDDAVVDSKDLHNSRGSNNVLRPEQLRVLSVVQRWIMVRKILNF